MIQKIVLSIAGSDPSGGAGIQADLKTFEAFDVYGMSVVTALTAQNTMGVSEVLAVDSSFTWKQLEAVLDDITPDAVKIGMLPDRETMEVVCRAIDEYGLVNVVLDPVLSSTSGTELSRKEALGFMKEELFKRCLLITPNIPEAEKLCETTITSRQDMERAADELFRSFGCNVLIKGGHSSFDKVGVCEDLLYAGQDQQIGDEFDKSSDEKEIWLSGKRIDNPNTHGTGCTLSSAIASGLAKGESLENSVRCAKEYITGCIEAGLQIGRGRGPLYHGLKT